MAEPEGADVLAETLAQIEPADSVSFDHCRAQPQLSRADRGHVATRPGPDDRDVVVRH